MKNLFSGALTLIPVALLAVACAPQEHTESNGTAQIASAQIAGGRLPISEWRLDESLPVTEVQGMRDRAYAFCLRARPSDDACFDRQDESLIMASHAIGIWRSYRDDEGELSRYAQAYRSAPPGTFEDIRAHCWSIYTDNGSADARMLGPCMLNAVGGDYFGVLPVP